MHGQLYNSTSSAALDRSLAGQIAAEHWEAQKGTPPQFREGRAEASLGWQTLKPGLVALGRKGGGGELTDGFWLKDMPVSEVNDRGSLGTP